MICQISWITGWQGQVAKSSGIEVKIEQDFNNLSKMPKRIVKNIRRLRRLRKILIFDHKT